MDRLIRVTREGLSHDPQNGLRGMGNLASPATGEDGAEAEEQCCA
jgi:hypothetical protein